MKLDVAFSSSREGHTRYAITQVRRGDFQKRTATQRQADAHHLMGLHERIASMAHRQLGTHFHRLASLNNTMLFLHVEVGTSSGDRRFDLSALLGWIKLCDDEQ